MSWVHNEYAFRALSHLSRFRQVNNVSQFKLNCRCPVCGDSQKDIMKARFWAYGTGDDVFLKCYNCDYGKPIGVYLKEYEPDLYREFILELRKDKMTFKPDAKPEVKKVEIKEPEGIKLVHCSRLDSLPEEHPIIKYVKHRCIPKSRWNRLYFTMEWPALVNSVNPGTYKNERTEPRLVIPIFNEKGVIESFQGRALRKDAPQKYITIKSNEFATKIYGTDTVKTGQNIFVLEGPIDSLFLDNAIAITGGAMDLELVPFKDERVWIMDHEPRKEDTIKRMKRLIDAGERLVFWDKSPWKEKDINDMIKNEGASIKDIQNYINENIDSGLMAQLRLKRYSKTGL
ncbi:DNA primase [Salmonella phage vB_SnwM_CGG4-1]|uniref:DNA primase/helicase n=1 Tax=Salmonella phage vB_SnwM_CGG4-1 TaxID=1815631 RepID=A0A1B0VV66_9CAUD|nr:DNA primase [Salmonella phage vB_SnwM_CGG4-1]ANA49381.1 DNA primase/helicase [Salmonella phage vB_SnwM_CGG4-1]